MTQGLVPGVRGKSAPRARPSGEFQTALSALDAPVVKAAFGEEAPLPQPATPAARQAAIRATEVWSNRFIVEERSRALT